MIVTIIVYELIITVTNTVIISVTVIIINIQSNIWQKANEGWFGMGSFRDKREIKVKRARSDKIFLSSSRRHPRRQCQPKNL